MPCFWAHPKNSWQDKTRGEFSSFRNNGSRILSVDSHKGEAQALCCYNCEFWCGRCRKGRVNRIAKDPKCDDFKPKEDYYEPIRRQDGISDFLKYTR